MGKSSRWGKLIFALFQPTHINTCEKHVWMCLGNWNGQLSMPFTIIYRWLWASWTIAPQNQCEKDQLNDWVSKRNLWKQFWSILSSTTREISSNWKLSPTNRALFQVERIRWGHRGPPVGLLVTPVSLGPKSWKKLRHQRDYHIYTFNTIDNTIRVDFWSGVYHGYHLWSVYHTCRLSHDPMCVIDICMAENLRRTKLNDFSQIKKYLI